MIKENRKGSIIPAFDPLDMNNYRIEKLKKIEKSGVGRWMQVAGIPLAILAFIYIYYFCHIPFLDHLDPGSVTGKPLVRLNELGPERFIRINYAMVAVFVSALILWLTEAIPNYLTSLIVIISIVLTGITTEKTAYAQLGHPVMWLNILSFILASMLVKTKVAKRFALYFVLKFGKNASRVFMSFIVINLVLSAFISATTAKAAILLPIFMVIAAIYGATPDNRNNFGRNIVLQNLFQINIGSTGFITGSGANLLAGALMAGAMGNVIFGFQDWFIAAFPLAVTIIVVGWLVGTRLIFPMKKEERSPVIEGGMARLREEYDKLGRMGVEEYKAVAIFCIVLALWATDKQHGISQTAIAFLGAVFSLLPKVGVVKWNDVDIPWHLLLFSAGAYTLGAGFDATGLPSLLVGSIFSDLGVSTSTPFWALYLGLTAATLCGALIFQSKTMLTLIFVPIAIGVAQQFGYPVMSLAFPVALLISHVYVFPFNSKPAALLYTTGHYSMGDSFRFGMVMIFVSWVLMIIWGETVFKVLGYTPDGVFF